MARRKGRLFGRQPRLFTEDEARRLLHRTVVARGNGLVRSGTPGRIVRIGHWRCYGGEEIELIVQWPETVECCGRRQPLEDVIVTVTEFDFLLRVA